MDPAETVSMVSIRKLKSASYPVDARPEVYTLFRTQKSTHTTAIFSGMVPAGRYTLVRATGVQGNTTYSFPLEIMVSQFEVKTNQVSFLGTLVIHPLEGKRFNVGYVPPDGEMQETFEQLFPSMAQQTKGQPFNAMEMTPLMRQRSELAPYFKPLTTAMNGMFQSDSGDFYYGSKLGTAYWRKAGTKSWRFVDVGSWREVLTLRPLGSALVAAGEEGLLRYSVDEGKTWASLVPPEHGSIHALIPTGGGKVAALVKRDDLWTVYTSSDLWKGRWQKLDSFPHESSINIPWQRSPHIISTPSWLGVMMPNGILYGVDLKTEKLSRRANNSFSARDLISLGGDSILLKGVRFATTFLISDDLGQTWTELPLSRFPGFVAAKDRRNLFALTSEGGVSGGQIQMKGSRDGGVTWSVTGTPPTKPGWVSIVGMQIDKYDGSLLLFYKDGNRMRSQDEGKTWSAD